MIYYWDSKNLQYSLVPEKTRVIWRGLKSGVGWGGGGVTVMKADDEAALL